MDHHREDKIESDDAEVSEEVAGASSSAASAEGRGTTRRRLIKAGAVAIPLIVSMRATPASAAGQVPYGYKSVIRRR